MVPFKRLAVTERTQHDARSRWCYRQVLPSRSRRVAARLVGPRRHDFLDSRLRPAGGRDRVRPRADSARSPGDGGARGRSECLNARRRHSVDFFYSRLSIALQDSGSRLDQRSRPMNHRNFGALLLLSLVDCGGAKPAAEPSAISVASVTPSSTPPAPSAAPVASVATPAPPSDAEKAQKARAKVDAEHQKELARWTPELHAQAKRLAETS